MTRGTILTLFIILELAFSGVYGVYFSMVEMEVKLPQIKEKLPPGNHPLLTLYAHQEQDEHEKHQQKKVEDNNDNTFFRYTITGGVNVTISNSSKNERNLGSSHTSTTITSNNYISIYPTTGDVMFTQQFTNDFLSLQRVKFDVNVVDSSNDKERDQTSVVVNILPINDCDQLLNDICFFANIKYRLDSVKSGSKHGRKGVTVGPLSAPYIHELCPHYRLNYTIAGFDAQHFELLPPPYYPTWSLIFMGDDSGTDLWSNSSLKTLKVTCEIESIDLKSKYVVEKELVVEAVEADRHPPIPQHKELTINMGDFIQKGHVIQHEEIIFKDKDPPSVNHYRYRILQLDNNNIPKISGKDDSTNGRHNSQKLEHTSNTFDNVNTQQSNGAEKVAIGVEMVDNLLMPKCKKMLGSRDGRQTAIHCKLVFNENKHFKNQTKYSVVLEVNDTSYIGKGSGVAHLVVHLNFDKQIHPANQKGIDNRPQLILYPERQVKIFRTTAPLARVTQPKSNDNFDFQMKELNVNNILFNITRQEGIVFVHDIGQLRKAPEVVQLNISWMNNKSKRNEFDLVDVRIIEEPTKTCDKMPKEINKWYMCAEYQSYEECTAADSCALATGGAASVAKRKGPERCMWRGDKYPGLELTHWYATCTPDIDTCPDGICDSLEMLHSNICPQDCATNLHIPSKLNKKTGRGIDEGSGVCFCDSFGSCGCDKPKKIKKGRVKSTTLSPINSTAMANFTSIVSDSSPQPSIVQANIGRHTGVVLGGIECGTTCVLGIVAGTFLLGGAVLLVTICLRLDRVHKAVTGKYYTGENQDMQAAAPLSDYIDRSNGGVGGGGGGSNGVSETLAINFNMISGSGDRNGIITTTLDELETINIIKKYQVPDPKWEFPRSQLLIEQTLGEGEFGRVLRAKALNIADQPGYTTVAVKTLKEDAREQELNDLLSEYQLLKEVSHKNVIKLLGVCTLPGGPIYLIIEFAEYGSLRNYLRRSRHLKSENPRLPFSNADGLEAVHYDEPNISQITPKEILCFAWQICNGMAYLSDIKLVHRDLAARNVLLAADKVCKISDFGLTRDIYEDNAYFKRSKGRVPVKWMAPESLADHIYTSKSDVWSFGVLIWELVTLGATPYPGIAVQNLFHLLKQGYRMERPDNCSQILYAVMKSCWHISPEMRPSFHELSTQFENMIKDGVDYLDLTNNAIHNRSYFCSNFDNINEDEKQENRSNSLNYLSKSQSYEKCGATDKLLDSPKTETFDSTVLQTPEENMLITPNPEGYESPIKLPNSADNKSLNSPLQEYTDMQQQNNVKALVIDNYLNSN